jgi:hypothetical protein
MPKRTLTDPSGCCVQELVYSVSPHHLAISENGGPGLTKWNVFPTENMDSLVINLCSCLFVSGSFYVAQVVLKLILLLPQPPKCWDYRHELP